VDSSKEAGTHRLQFAPMRHNDHSVFEPLFGVYIGQSGDHFPVIERAQLHPRVAWVHDRRRERFGHFNPIAVLAQIMRLSEKPNTGGGVKVCQHSICSFTIECREEGK